MLLETLLLTVHFRCPVVLSTNIALSGQQATIDSQPSPVGEAPGNSAGHMKPGIQCTPAQASHLAFSSQRNA